MEFRFYLEKKLFSYLDRIRKDLALVFLQEGETQSLEWPTLLQLVSSHLNGHAKIVEKNALLRFELQIYIKKLTKHLKACSCYTKTILENNGLSRAFELIDTEISWANIFIGALSMKVHASHAELNNDNSSDLIAEILSHTHILLSEKKSHLQGQIDHLKRLYEAYENSDFEFKDLASTYGKLKKRVKTKEWALNEFNLTV